VVRLRVKRRGRMECFGHFALAEASCGLRVTGSPTSTFMKFLSFDSRFGGRRDAERDFKAGARVHAGHEAKPPARRLAAVLMANLAPGI
jgi:hypothetical protein